MLIKRLFTALFFTTALAYSVRGQSKFNWTDTLFSVGQTRTLMLYRDFNGPCTARPCYNYHNKQTYDTLVSFLTKNNKLYVAFFWHTWTTDDSEYNLVVSKRMAEGLIVELSRLGIDKEKISAIGLGEAKPLISETDLLKIEDYQTRMAADGRNRRVEMMIVSTPYSD